VSVQLATKISDQLLSDPFEPVTAQETEDHLHQEKGNQSEREPVQQTAVSGFEHGVEQLAQTERHD
jgi:hypothetical protein